MSCLNEVENNPLAPSLMWSALRWAAADYYDYYRRTQMEMVSSMSVLIQHLCVCFDNCARMLKVAFLILEGPFNIWNMYNTRLFCCVLRVTPNRRRESRSWSLHPPPSVSLGQVSSKHHVTESPRMPNSAKSSNIYILASFRRTGFPFNFNPHWHAHSNVT